MPALWTADLGVTIGARTDQDGIVKVTARLALPGRFKALARKGGSYGLSKFIPVR